MGPVVKCKICQNRIAFSKVVSVSPGGGKDNVFLCPCCGGQDWDVSHLNPYRRKPVKVGTRAAA